MQDALQGMASQGAQSKLGENAISERFSERLVERSQDWLEFTSKELLQLHPQSREYLLDSLGDPLATDKCSFKMGLCCYAIVVCYQRLKDLFSNGKHCQIALRVHLFFRDIDDRMDDRPETPTDQAPSLPCISPDCGALPPKLSLLSDRHVGKS